MSKENKELTPVKCPLCPGVDMVWNPKYEWWEDTWCGTIQYHSGELFFEQDRSNYSTREIIARVGELLNKANTTINQLRLTVASLQVQPSLQSAEERIHELETELSELKFYINHIFNDIQDEITTEKYCKYCETEWDTYITESHPHLTTCIFYILKKSLTKAKVVSSDDKG